MSTERDPVCGMTVDSDSAAASLVQDGRTYYFDSTECRDRFAREPARYAGQRDQVEMERHEPPRTTTGSFTAPKFGSAGSGGLEFERLPEQHDHDDEPHR